MFIAASWQVRTKTNNNWNDGYLNKNLHSISEDDAVPKREINNSEAKCPDGIKIKAGEKFKQKLPEGLQIDVGSKPALGLLNIASWFPSFTGLTRMIASKVPKENKQEKMK